MPEKDLLKNVLKTKKKPVESTMFIPTPYISEELREDLRKIRENQDFAPILERLDRIESFLIKILDKVDLTEEEQEVLELLRLELSKKP